MINKHKLVKSSDKSYKFKITRSLDDLQYKRYDKKYILKRATDNNYYLVANSNNELFNYFLDVTINYKDYILMKEERKKLNNSDIIRLIFNHIPIVNKILPNGDMMLFTYSHDKKHWVLLQEILIDLVVSLGQAQILTINDYKFVVNQMLIALTSLIKRNKKQIAFNPPPKTLIKLNNGVFDNKSKRMLKKSEYENYHFVKSNDWKLIEPKKRNKFYEEVSRRIIRDWSDNNPEKELLIWQLIISCIEGDGRNKAIIIKSDGGGGKTSLQKLIRQIIGNDKVINCGLYELNNDNKLANLKPETHVILGDDADTNKKMPSNALSRLKSLSDGGTVSIDVKYEASRDIMFDGIFIQNTNTDIAFYENNQALASRMIKLNWTNQNFRENQDDFAFDLKDLLGNPNVGKPANKEFIETFLSIALWDIPYFKQFTIPEEVQADTNELLNENDQVKGYVDFLELQGVTKLPYLNTTTEHARYVAWLTDTNPSAKPLKIRNFNKEFEHHMTNLGFTITNNLFRPVSFSILDYNNEVINNVTGYDINEYPKRKTLTKYWYNPRNLISKASVNIKDELDINSAIDVQKYYYLAYEQNEVSIIDKYQSLIED